MKKTQEVFSLEKERRLTEVLWKDVNVLQLPKYGFTKRGNNKENVGRNFNSICNSEGDN